MTSLASPNPSTHRMLLGWIVSSLLPSVVRPAPLLLSSPIAFTAISAPGPQILTSAKFSLELQFSIYLPTGYPTKISTRCSRAHRSITFVVCTAWNVLPESSNCWRPMILKSFAQMSLPPKLPWLLTYKWSLLQATLFCFLHRTYLELFYVFAHSLRILQTDHCYLYKSRALLILSSTVL